MFPLGPFFARNITLKMGQAPARSYMKTIYDQIVNGEVDPTTIITHKLSLDDAAYGYDIFNERQDGCIKVILKP